MLLVIHLLRQQNVPVDKDVIEEEKLSLLRAFSKRRSVIFVGI